MKFLRHLRTALLMAMAAGPVAAVAAPASGRPVKMTAPDGTEWTVVAVGDENQRHFETLDGKIVTWLPAVRQELKLRPLNLRKIERRMQIAARPAQITSPAPASQASQTGQTCQTGPTSLTGLSQQLAPGRQPGSSSNKFLVVLIDFPDRPFVTDQPLNVFSRMMTGDDFYDNGACGSARVYFEENSGGNFLPDFEVVGPVTMDKNAVNYASVGLDDSPASKMVVEACQKLDSQLDFSDYDLNGDGVCDNVYFFYAGKGQADGGGSTTIWPHSASLSMWNKSLKLDGVNIENYACSPEMNGSNRLTGIGTFCHEFCHVLGLVDLYSNGVLHPGSYSLMASGNYNNNGHTPPALSSYERYALGWLSPQELVAGDDASETVTLPRLLETNTARIAKTERDNEYFLFENRQREGWDKYLPGHGMLVWHIDYDKTAWDNNTPNRDRNHQRVDIVEANGATSGSPSAGWTFPGSSDVTAFGPATAPALKSWAGKSTGVSLEDIAETSAGDVTFRAVYENSGVENIESEFDTAEVTGVYSLSGQYLGRDSREVADGGYSGICIVRYADGSATKLLLR